MVIFEQDLVNSLRTHCDNAKKRILIVCPFVGTLKDIHRIIAMSPQAVYEILFKYYHK